MKKININSADFVYALRIKERSKLYNEKGIVNFNFDDYDKWVNVRGVFNEKDAAAMLEAENMTSEEFNNGLKELNDEEKQIASEAVDKSEWFGLYKEIMNKCAEKIEKLSFPSDKLDIGISVLPFTLYCGERLSKQINNMNKLSVGEKVIQTMIEKISGNILSLLIKTVVWDFRSGTDTTDTENNNDEAFQKYIRDNFLDMDGILSFYSRYPVIARRAAIKSKQISDHFIEMLERIENDYDGLCSILGTDKITSLDGINAEQGDTHDKGRFVVKLDFSEGTIIYKPRNLRVQEELDHTLSSVCGQAGTLPLYYRKTIYHDNYAFDTFVEYEECTSEEQVKNYYRRFGQICAIIYMLRGNDIHYENIIAHGEYPVLIDVETLFQHQGDVIERPDNAASDVYIDSVSSVGGTAMVPIITFNQGKNGKGIDISALGGKEQELPYKVLQLVNSGTDNMKFDYVDAKMSGANNLPKLNGEVIDFNEYTDIIIDGFRKTMDYILRNKELFIGNGGLVERYSDIRVRHLMKATQNYAKIMTFSSHPNYSENMVKLERMFANIWDYNYKDKRIVRFETDDMIDGDIPIFYGKINSKEIIASSGEKLDDYFETSAYDKVVARFETLDEAEIERQVSQMKVCMNMFETENHEKAAGRKSGNRVKKPTRSELLQKAEEIADTIVDNAHFNKNTQTVEWNNVVYDNINGCWKTRGISCGLTIGQTGVFNFLYLLNKHINKYDDVLNSISHSFTELPAEYLPLSLSDGIASVFYSYMLVYRESQNKRAENMMGYYANIIKDKLDDCDDDSFMYGLAGILAVMSSAWKLTKNDLFKDIALRAYNIISERYTIDENDLSFYSGMAGVSYAASMAADTFELEDRVFADELSRQFNKFNAGSKISFALNRENMQRIVDTVKSMNTKTDSFAGGLGEKIFHLVSEKKYDEAEEVAGIMINDGENGGYIFPTINGYTSVGFMYGLSGIGYSLLKCYDHSLADVPLFV